jgi:DnaK suppressor protein
MVPEQIKKFKRIFEAQLQSLKQSSKTQDLAFGVAPEETIDPIDHARSQADQFLRIQMRNRENDVLGKITSALKRIADGTFGFCLNCEEAIGLRRLEARPTATLCHPCQSSTETSAATPGLVVSAFKAFRRKGA